MTERNQRQRRPAPGLIFFLATSGLTLILWLVHPAAVVRAVPFFVSLLGRIWPVLIFVFGLLFLSNLFLSPQLVKRWLGHASRKRGWLIAIAGGILSSGPIYLWYPLLRELKEHGMRTALAAAFLYNRSVKPALLPLLIYYFGWGLTLILTVYTVAFSIIQGLIVERAAGSVTSPHVRA